MASEPDAGIGIRAAVRRGVPREVIAISIARFCDAFGNSILFVVLPLYFVGFAGSVALPEQAAVGILIATYAISTASCQPLVGWLSDHLGRRKSLILAGLAIVAVSTFSFNIATLFLQLLVLRVIQGIGVALTIPTSFAVISLSTHRRQRATAMAFYSTARMLGFGIGPLLGGFMLVNVGYFWSFATAAMLVLAGMILVALLLDERRLTPRGDAGDARPAPLSFRELLGRRGMLPMVLINFTLALMINMLPPLEKWVNERLGQSAAEFGVALSVMLLANLLAQLPVGRISDAAGRRPLIITGMALMVPAIVTIGLATSTWVLLAALAVLGISAAMLSSPTYALAADLAPPGSAAKQMSVLTTAYGTGMALGPLLSGFLAGYFFYELPFLMAGVLTVITMIYVILNVDEAPREVADGGAGDVADESP